MAGDRQITSEEVISRLKDDGDFDRLRLKIIRKLKDNEELRNSIIAVVKQSEALNRPGAENMKPRELCDIIHEEVREKVMCQVSDGLWEIIRSADGMKAEITDAVQSVYDKLNPSVKMEGQSTSSSHVITVQDITNNGASQLGDGQLKNSRGFHPHNHREELQTELRHHNPGDNDMQHREELREPCQAPGHLEHEDGDPSPPPGFSFNGKHKELPDGSDDELDVPPGFG